MKQRFSNFCELESQSQALFARARESAPKPSPYLKSRVLFALERRKKKRVRLVRWLSWATTMLAVGLFGFWVGQIRAPHKAFVGQAQLVRVTPAIDDEVAFASVALPAGVQFYSERFPAVENHKELRFEWKKDQTELPIVVKSFEQGKHSIVVQFFGKTGELLLEKSVPIRFKPERG